MIVEILQIIMFDEPIGKGDSQLISSISVRAYHHLCNVTEGLQILDLVKRVVSVKNINEPVLTPNDQHLVPNHDDRADWALRDRHHVVRPSAEVPSEN